MMPEDRARIKDTDEFSSAPQRRLRFSDRVKLREPPHQIFGMEMRGGALPARISQAAATFLVVEQHTRLPGERDLVARGNQYSAGAVIEHLDEFRQVRGDHLLARRLCLQGHA